MPASNHHVGQHSTIMSAGLILLCADALPAIYKQIERDDPKELPL
jgi:hypothetical protein